MVKALYAAAVCATLLLAGSGAQSYRATSSAIAAKAESLAVVQSDVTKLAQRENARAVAPIAK